MKKVIYYSLISILITSFISCKSIKLENDPFAIKAGMTKENVLDAIGKPDERQFNNTQEAWMYIAASTPNKFYIVWFDRDYVTGFTSHNVPSLNFHNLNWEEKTIKTPRVIHNTVVKETPHRERNE